MNDSYDIDDLCLNACTRDFAEPEKAKFRLDSIGFLALKKGLGLPRTLEHLKTLANIAKQYRGAEQIKALIVLERRYAEALNEKNSRLCEYILSPQPSWEDPVQRLSNRFKTVQRQVGRILRIDGLDRGAEDAFGAPRFVEKSMIWSNRRTGYIASF